MGFTFRAEGPYGGAGLIPGLREATSVLSAKSTFLPSALVSILQGDSADSFFIVESGEVKITMKRKVSVCPALRLRVSDGFPFDAYARVTGFS